MADRCSGTGEVLPSVAVMFRRHQLHDMAISKSGTNRIGTCRPLAPVATRDEVNTCKLATNRGITDDIQQAPMGIAQYNHIAGVSQKVYQMAHHRACGSYQQLIGGTYILQLNLTGHCKGRETTRWIDL